MVLDYFFENNLDFSRLVNGRSNRDNVVDLILFFYVFIMEVKFYYILNEF